MLGSVYFEAFASTIDRLRAFRVHAFFVRKKLGFTVPALISISFPVRYVYVR